MSGKKHMFLALDRAAWGRVALGLEIAHELETRGDEVIFVASSTTAPVARTGKFRVEELTNHLGPLGQLFVELCLETEAPQSIVLCDFHSCCRYFELRGVDPMFVLNYGAPVIAMDIWDSFETEARRDFVGGETAPRADGIEKLAGRLVPVPIGRPAASGAYRSLSASLMLPRHARDDVRRRLGLTDTDRAVLFCTAGWQHEIDSPDCRRLANMAPQLLCTYLAQVGAAVRLIHIGPTPLLLDAARDRYFWIPSVTQGEFDQLLASVDLFLSANISATTIGRAIASGVPVLVVQNSYRAGTAEEARTAIRGCVSARLEAWLAKAAPLYPFSVWPLGYWSFLRPLLRDNPYCSALNILELLDEPAFIEICRGVLFEPSTRSAAIARQTAYADMVRQLPAAAELIDSYLD